VDVLGLNFTSSGWPQTWKTWNTQWFLWTWKTREILREFCAASGKNCNKQTIFSSSFKYLSKTSVDYVNRIIRNRDEVRVWWWPVMLLELMWNDPWWRSLLRLLFVAITYGKISLWLWKSLENLGNFFLLLFGHADPEIQLGPHLGQNYWTCKSNLSNDDKSRLVSLLSAANSPHALQLCWNLPRLAIRLKFCQSQTCEKWPDAGPVGIWYGCRC